ncbi:MAG: nitronate monooxygenase [Nevskia sp.]|nr:nitronate monooxygenase [Nevskia sp.]
MPSQSSSSNPNVSGGAALRRRLRAQLRLPVVVAPMFLVSGPELVVAACRSGMIGAFPTLNARTPEILDGWLARIAQSGAGAAPYAANLILDKRNPRCDEDLAVLERHRPPIVIASVGRPDRVVGRIHAYGGLVFADVASLRHARNAAAAGVDGLVLLTAGAGGNTGWLNPFAFVAAVREFFDGVVAVAGAIASGRELRALEVLGADLGYMGTAFLATEESMAPAGHKQAMLQADADGIVQTDALSGYPANFLRSRLLEAGAMRPDGSIDRGASADVYSWKHVWSAGHGVGQVRAIEPVAAVAARLQREYDERQAA